MEQCLIGRLQSCFAQRVEPVIRSNVIRRHDKYPGDT